MTRDASGKAFYIVASSREAKVFQRAVIEMFSLEIQARYRIKKWTPGHCYRIGQNWKNLFLKWIQEQIDEDNN